MQFTLLQRRMAKFETGQTRPITLYTKGFDRRHRFIDPLLKRGPAMIQFHRLAAVLFQRLALSDVSKEHQGTPHHFLLVMYDPQGFVVAQ